ncbi:GGDEF domain-containing protein [Rhodococcus sovatensis]|uniref:GGDEF domain-containing protein n=1 Tax=Rhodococcus sovatensis TaxID=1805840 RepID=A0ABZ2PF24_9NOCA
MSPTSSTARARANPATFLGVRTRRLIAASTANASVIGAVALTDSQIFINGSAWVVATILVLNSAMAVAWMTVEVRRCSLAALLFGIWAEAAIVAILLLLASPSEALVAAPLLMAPGLYLLLALGQKSLAVHSGVVLATVVVLTLAALKDGSESVATIVVRAQIVVTVALGGPATLQALWSRMIRQSQLARRDALTGLYNRRGLSDGLDELASGLVPLGGAAPTVAAVVVDIDSFKSVNDNYGHAVGDTVLTDVAHQLTRYVGPDAIVARTGGEEFTAIVTGPRTAVDQIVTSFPTSVSPRADAPPVTLSVGATIVPACGAPPSTEQLLDAIREADVAMYEAKRNGGGTVARASHEDAERQPRTQGIRHIFPEGSSSLLDQQADPEETKTVLVRGTDRPDSTFTQYGTRGDGRGGRSKCHRQHRDPSQ